MLRIPWLEDDSTAFPPASEALKEPNGLLAVGGDLSPSRLLQAYSSGIFPWYEEGQPILWWSPDPRMVLAPGQVHLSRSLRKFMRQCPHTISMDRAFPQVIRQCAASRDYADGTWIVPDMQHAYSRLHELGHAHSVEVWNGQQLVGGLYGVSLGRMFFGESMFSLEDNTSKLAFVSLCLQLERWGYGLIDCQLPTDHLRSLGAAEMPRREFLQKLSGLISREFVQEADQPAPARKWHFEADTPNALLMWRK